MLAGRGGLALLGVGRSRRFMAIADLTNDPRQDAFRPFPVQPSPSVDGSPGPLTLLSCDGHSPWVPPKEVKSDSKDKERDVSGHWTLTKTTLVKKLTQDMLDNAPKKDDPHNPSGLGPIPVQWHFLSGGDLTFQGWVGGWVGS